LTVWLAKNTVNLSFRRLAEGAGAMIFAPVIQSDLQFALSSGQISPAASYGLVFPPTRVIEKKVLKRPSLRPLRELAQYGSN